VESEVKANLGAKNHQKEKSKMDINKIIKEEIENVKMVDYHVRNKIPFSENVYRVGSDNYFKVIKEARKAYKLGEIKPMNEEDRDLFNNSHLGEWAIFEGERVPLDFPMYIETFDKSKRPITRSREEIMKAYRKSIRDQYRRRKISYEDAMKLLDAAGWAGDLKKEEKTALDEKKKKKKDPPIGKPTKNTGGGKKYKVFVRNPKTGKIKKITYGDSKGGLKGNWNSAEARKNFASRHKCAEKKDRTKAGYWACRAHKDFGTNVPGRFW
jgi:hypothetical protein